MKNALKQAQEQERKRLAQELHDSVLQELHCLNFRLADWGSQFSDAKHLQTIRQFRVQVLQTIDTLRSICHELHVSYNSEYGFPEAIQAICSDFHLKYRLTIELAPLVYEGDLPLLIHWDILRFLRELLTNCWKHANASHVRVIFWSTNTEIYLQVADNGCGFFPPQCLSQFFDGQHIGLFSIEERVRYYGGHLEISSSPGAGTRITLRIPAFAGKMDEDSQKQQAFHFRLTPG